MTTSLAILESMPTAAEFYKTYWNKSPFLVRAAFSEDIMEPLISADELAGLSMEEGVNGRLVDTDGDFLQWSCRFGPFSEKELTTLPNTNWSLLVQNVEQFHPETADLLAYFHFAPRWMIDDVMVSLSAPGGSVGPHMDSYHVFLVQGQGIRNWTIGADPITTATYVDNPDLKILDTPIQGDQVVVRCGDVLYLPPFFGHQGTTVETALTFSVGFLGPKLSELFGSYGEYLAERESYDIRYTGVDLTTESAGYRIDGGAVAAIRNHLAEHFNTPEFSDWLVSFFTDPGFFDAEDEVVHDVPATENQLMAALQQGAVLSKPEAVKFALTKSGTGRHHFGFCGQSCHLDEDQVEFVDALTQGLNIGLDSHPSLTDQNNLCLLFTLYMAQALELKNGDGSRTSA